MWVKSLYLIVVFILALVVMSYYVGFRYFVGGSAQMTELIALWERDFQSQHPGVRFEHRLNGTVSGMGGLYGGGVYVAPGAVPGPGIGGISLAGRAGITLNEPMQTGVQSSLAPSWPAYANGVYPGYAGGYYGASAEAAGAESSSVAPGKAVVDLGPSYAADGGAQASPVSVGDVAAYYKRNQHQNVRIYTNADAQHFTNKVIIPHTKPGGPPGATSPPPPTAPPPR